MIFKSFCLIILSLFLAFNINAQSKSFTHSTTNLHNNIHMHRNQGQINNFYILFIVIKTGPYNCISHYIANSRFKDNIKVRSISVDTLRIKPNQTIEVYEQLIKNKLVNEFYNFIIILDEFGSLSPGFYKFVRNEYKNNSVIVSYSSSADIYLSLTFDRFFTFIQELFNINEVTIHYLYNVNTSMNDVYSELLNIDYGMKAHLIKHQLLYRKDLTILLNTLSKEKNIVVISNLDYLLDDVSGKLLVMTDITGDFEYYNKNNILLTITHNMCKKIKTAFSLSWDGKYVSTILDNFISDKQQHISLTKIIVPSTFSIDFTLGAELLKKYDINKLENLLEYTDNVINNE